MRLVTYQPIDKMTDESIRARCIDEVEAYLGYKPVFCIPAVTQWQFLFGSIFCLPSAPERIIALDTDDYVMIDQIKLKYLCCNVSHPSVSEISYCFDSVNPDYACAIVKPEQLHHSVYDHELIDVLSVHYPTDRRNPNRICNSQMNYFLDLAAESLNQNLTDQMVLAESDLYAFKAVVDYASVFLYKIMFNEKISNFDVVDLAPFDAEKRIMEEMKDMLFSFPCVSIKSMYEHYESIMSRFEYMLKCRNLDIAKNLQTSRTRRLSLSENYKCPCGSGKLFKQCHGADVSVRMPKHIC